MLNTVIKTKNKKLSVFAWWVSYSSTLTN